MRTMNVLRRTHRNRIDARLLGYFVSYRRLNHGDLYITQIDAWIKTVPMHGYMKCWYGLIRLYLSFQKNFLTWWLSAAEWRSGFGQTGNLALPPGRHSTATTKLAGKAVRSLNLLMKHSVFKHMENETRKFHCLYYMSYVLPPGQSLKRMKLA